MKSAYMCFLVLVACLSCAGLHAADATLPPRAPGGLAERLRSDSATELNQHLNTLQTEREATIWALIDLASSSEEDIKSQDVKHRAMELLGKYRAVEACSVLIRQIEFYPPHLLISQDPLYRYPAAVALDAIGEPAIRRILTARMGSAASDTELKIFAYLVWCHYAPQHEQEVGMFRMERLLEREKAERKKYAKTHRLDLGRSIREKNLSRLIEIYKAISPNDPKDWPTPAAEKM